MGGYDLPKACHYPIWAKIKKIKLRIIQKSQCEILTTCH